MIESHTEFLKNQLQDVRTIIGKLQEQMNLALNREQQILGGLQVLKLLANDQLPPQSPDTTQTTGDNNPGQ